MEDTQTTIQRAHEQLKLVLEIAENIALTDEVRGVLLHLNEARDLLELELSKFTTQPDSVPSTPEPAPTTEPTQPQPSTTDQPAAPAPAQPSDEVPTPPAPEQTTDTPTQPTEQESTPTANPVAPGSPEAAMSHVPNEVQQAEVASTTTQPATEPQDSVADQPVRTQIPVQDGNSVVQPTDTTQTPQQ